MIKNKIGRGLVFAFGIFFLILGIVGVFLPLLPTTPFVLLAATCFVNSSPKALAWLERQPVIGPALQNWQRSKSISRGTKVQAVSLMIISLVFIWYKVPNQTVNIAVTLMLTLVAAFIVSRPEKS